MDLLKIYSYFLTIIVLLLLIVLIIWWKTSLKNQIKQRRLLKLLNQRLKPVLVNIDFRQFSIDPARIANMEKDFNPAPQNYCEKTNLLE